MSDWTHREQTKQAPMFVATAGPAAEAVGTLAPGCRVIGITKGQFSLRDIIDAVLSQTGPADVVLATWTVGEMDAKAVAWLLNCGQIRSLKFLVDRSFPARQPGYARSMIDLFGQSAIVVSRNHAKFAVITNDDWAITVRTSMNLNKNRRFEQFDIDESRPIAAHFLRLVAEISEHMSEGFDVPGAEVEQAMDSVWGKSGPSAPSGVDMTGFASNGLGGFADEQ